MILNLVNIGNGSTLGIINETFVKLINLKIVTCFDIFCCYNKDFDCIFFEYLIRWYAYLELWLLELFHMQEVS